MNREQTAEAIKVMQGFVDGKPVEFRLAGGDSHWFQPNGPHWDWSRNEYRLAPPKPWYRVGRLTNGGGLWLANQEETEARGNELGIDWLTDRIEYEPAEGGAK